MPFGMWMKGGDGRVDHVSDPGDDGGRYYL